MLDDFLERKKQKLRKTANMISPPVIPSPEISLEAQKKNLFRTGVAITPREGRDYAEEYLRYIKGLPPEAKGVAEPRRFDVLRTIVDVLSRAETAGPTLEAIKAIKEGQPQEITPRMFSTYLRQIVTPRIREFAEIPGYAQVLKELGVSPGLFQTVIPGLALDIFLDPTTYIGGLGLGRRLFGKGVQAGLKTKAMVKPLGEVVENLIKKTAGREALASLGRETAEKMIRQYGKEAGEKALRQVKPELAEVLYRPKTYEIFEPKAPRRFMEVLRKPFKVEAGLPIGVAPIERAYQKSAQAYADSLTRQAQDVLGKLSAKERIILSEFRQKIIADAPANIKEANKFLEQAYGVFVPLEKQAGLTYKEMANYVKLAMLEAGEKRVFPGRLIGPDVASFTLRRTFRTTADAQAAGYKVVEDALEQYSLRARAHAYAVGKQSFLREIAETWGEKIVKGIRKTPGFRRTTVPQLKGWRLPEDVAQAVERTEEIITFGPLMEKLLDIYDRLQSLWKGAVTSIWPGFHGRNFYGSHANNYLDLGAKVFDIPAQVRAGILAWTTGKGKIVSQAGKSYSYDTIRELARLYGVKGYGWMGAEVAGRAGPISQLSPFRLGRRFGRFIEDQARMFNFVENLIKSDDALKASWRTKLFHFDYSEFTTFERAYLRRAYPFFTWYKNNIPLQFTMLLGRPDRMAAIGKTWRAVESMAEPRKREEEPLFFGEEMMIKTPLKVGGVQLYLRADIPQAQIAMIQEPLEAILDPTLNLSDRLKRLTAPSFEIMSPLLKVPLEILTNWSFFRERQIKRFPGEKRSAPPYVKLFPPKIKDFMAIEEKTDEAGKKQLLMDPFWAHILETMPFSYQAGLAVPTERYPGYLKYTWPFQVMSQLTGIKFFPVDVAFYRNQYYRESLERLRRMYPPGEERQPSPTVDRFLERKKQKLRQQ